MNVYRLKSDKDRCDRVESQENSRGRASIWPLPVEIWTVWSPLEIVCDIIPRVLPPKEGHLVLACPSVYWVQSCSLEWLPGSPCYVSYLVSRSSADGTGAVWPKAPIINYTVRLSGLAQDPKVNKDSLTRQDIPMAERIVPRSQGQRPDLSLGEINSLVQSPPSGGGWLN